MKRIVACLLAMVMLFTGVSVAEDRLPYTYAPVKIVLSNLDEDIFRQWAYGKLSQYHDVYLDPEYKLYMEYCNLAYYKEWYGRTLGKELNGLGGTKRTIAYTDPTMTEDQQDQMYLLMLLKSLQEMREIDPNYLTKYLNMSAKERKYYTLQMDGTFKEDPYLASVDKQSQADMAQALTDVVMDAADLVVSTYTAVYLPEGNKKDFAEKITEMVNTVIEDLAERIADNAKAKAENEIKRYLAELVMQTLSDAKLADMACLEEVYLSGNYPNERAVKVARQLYNYYNSDACNKELAAESMKEAERILSEEKVLDQFGMELQAELETSEILIMTVMDAVKLALNEWVDSFKENSKTAGALAKGYEDTITSLLTILVDKICENIQDNWIKTGSFSIMKGIEFEDDDWNELIQELQVFDLLSGAFTMKDLRKELAKTTVVDHVSQMNIELSERIRLLFLYYLFLDLPEAALDDLINKNTAKDYATAAYTSLKNHAFQLFEDCCAVITDYMKNKVKITASEQQDKLKELRKENKKAGSNVTADKQKEINDSATKTINDLNEKIKVIDTIASVAKKAWNLSESSVKAISETWDALVGEDKMSFLAEEAVTAEKLSGPLRVKLSSMDPQHILEKEKMSTAEVWEYVAAMQAMAKHDATGATAYYEVVLKAVDHKNTDFVKLLRGEKLSRHSINFEFWTIEYNYKNINGQTGLLPIGAAAFIRDELVRWKNWTDEDFDEEWLSIPELQD